MARCMSRKHHHQANFGTSCVGNTYSSFTPNVICVHGDHVKTNHCLVSIGDVEVRLVVVFMKVFNGVLECIALDDSLWGDADIHLFHNKDQHSCTFSTTVPTEVKL